MTAKERANSLQWIFEETIRAAQSFAVTAFAKAVLHGDDEHREWLLEAAQEWNAGRPLPAPRGKGVVQSLPEGKEGEGRE
jgi:hypothetical protein